MGRKQVGAKAGMRRLEQSDRQPIQESLFKKGVYRGVYRAGSDEGQARVQLSTLEPLSHTHTHTPGAAVVSAGCAVVAVRLQVLLRLPPLHPR